MINAAKNLVFKLLSPKQRFRHIYRTNQWGSAESVSGPGSDLLATEKLRARLVLLLRDLEIRSMVDVPCGDFNWMRDVVDKTGVEYTGLDIVPEIVSANAERYGGVNFAYADLTKDALPKADLVLSRDCFIHLSFADTCSALANIKRSGSRFVLLSNYPDVRRNEDIVTGRYRPINLLLDPYRLPEPELSISEDEPGKEMCLWAAENL